MNFILGVANAAPLQKGKAKNEGKATQPQGVARHLERTPIARGTRVGIIGAASAGVFFFFPFAFIIFFSFLSVFFLEGSGVFLLPR